MILTDVDQVLLDWIGPFEAWATARGWAALRPLVEVYAPSLAYGMTPEEEVATIAEFNASDALAGQPALACATAAVPLLRAAGWDFVAITACGPAAARIRPAVLGRAFGFAWERVEVVGLRESKVDVLRRCLGEFGPCPWVEDSVGHALDGAALGHRAFLMNHAYNASASCDGVERVDDWHGVLRALEPSLAGLAEGAARPTART